MSLSMVARVCFLSGCGVLAALNASGCQRSALDSPTAGSSEQSLKVVVVKPERRTLRRLIEQPAQVLAYERTPLVARIAGYVQKVYVDIGDKVKGPEYDDQGKQVKAGQVLAELWVPELEEELKQKRALVGQAQAQVAQAQASLEAADAHVTTSRALVKEAMAARTRVQANYERWVSEYKRVEAMVKRKVIDEQTRDETLNQYKAAEATRQEVEAKVHSAQAMAWESEAQRNKAKADLAAAQAKVEVAQADEGRAAAMLEYSKIRAPYDGGVSERHVHTGHYLQPASGKGADPLFVVSRSDVVRIVVEVPETEATFVQKGATVQIRVPAQKNLEFTGQVTRTSWVLNLQTRTLRTEIDIPNAQRQLRPGMYAYVAFTAELPDRLTLPLTAIRNIDDQPCCFLVEDSEAYLTPLKLGLRDGFFVEVLKKQVKSTSPSEDRTWEDFAGEETIVKSNLNILTDGQCVQIRQPRGK